MTLLRLIASVMLLLGGILGGILATTPDEAAPEVASNGVDHDMPAQSEAGDSSQPIDTRARVPVGADGLEKSSLEAAMCRDETYTPVTAQRSLAGWWCEPTGSVSSTAVLLVHGGGEVGGQAEHTGAWQQAYLDAGITTFAIDYTLGDPFDPVPLWPLPEQNVKAAVQFIRLHGKEAGIDRVAIHGFSSGARLAALALTTPNAPEFQGDELWPWVSDSVDAATLFYGYYDGSTFWSDYFSGPQPALASAIDNVDSFVAADGIAPTLIVHGRQDFLIGEEQSMRLAASLVEAGADVDLRLIEDESGHNFDGYGTDSLTVAGEDLRADVIAHALGVEAAEPAEPLDHVLLIGDSIAKEITEEFQRLLDGRGITLSTITWPGIAPCDALPTVRKYVDDPESQPPDAVIVLFTGNAATPCMNDALEVGSDEYFAAYERDVGQIVNFLDEWQANVWIPEGLPAADPEREAIADDLANRLQRLPGVSGSIPFGDLFTDSTGAYSTELPCVLPAEPCDTVGVRARDGGHLGDGDRPHGRNRMAHAFIRFLARQYSLGIPQDA